MPTQSIEDDPIGMEKVDFYPGGKLNKQAVAFALLRDVPHRLDARDDLYIYDATKGIYINGNKALERLVRRKYLQYTNASEYTRGVEKDVLAMVEAYIDESCRLPEQLPQSYACFTNGIVDLTTGQFIDVDPEKLCATNLIPHKWNPTATCDYFDEWLSDRLDNDTKLIQQLLEVSSQALDMSSISQKGLLLWGASRTGKGTYADLLRQCIGDKNTTGISFEQICDSDHTEFRASTYRKMLNISGEIKAISSRELDRWKEWNCGGDTQQVRSLYGHPFDMKYYGLPVYLGNRMPRVRETTDAYFNRLVLIPFNKTYQGQEDKAVGVRLGEDCEGILVKLVNAGIALRTRGRLTDSTPDVIELFRVSTDIVSRWLTDKIDAGFTKVTPKGKTLKPEEGLLLQPLWEDFRDAMKDDNYPMQGFTKDDFVQSLQREGIVVAKRNAYKEGKAGVGHGAWSVSLIKSK